MIQAERLVGWQASQLGEPVYVVVPGLWEARSVAKRFDLGRALVEVEVEEFWIVREFSLPERNLQC